MMRMRLATEGDNGMEVTGTTVGSPVLGGEKRVRGLGVRMRLNRVGGYDHGLPLNQMGGRGFSFDL